MEEILAKEEEHAEELKTLIQTISELEKKATTEPGQPLRRVS
jgi:bacterioferritin (cytochrome b1)